MVNVIRPNTGIHRIGGLIGSVDSFGVNGGIYNLMDALSSVDLSGPPGQVEYTTPGSYSWTVPVGVFEVSVLCIGGGGGGSQYSSNSSGAGGGGLGYINSYTVIPGDKIDIVVGAGGTRDTNTGTTVNGTDGGDSYFDTALVCKGGGGGAGT